MIPMRNGNHVSKRSVIGLRPFLLASAALVLILAPCQANAQHIVEDPATEAATLADKIANVAGWAAQGVQDAAEDLQFSVVDADTILGQLMNSLSQQLTALVNMTAAQAQIDAQSRETQKRLTTPITLEYSMLLPGGVDQNGNQTQPDQSQPGQNTGYNACNMANGNNMTLNTRVKEFGQAISAFTSQNVPGVGASGGNNDILNACIRGFVDTRPGSLVYAEAKQLKCPDATTMTWTGTNPDGSTSTYTNGYYIDADMKTDSITSHWYYSVPAQATISTTNNQMILPGSTSVKEEQDFIAAIYACKNFKPPTAAPDTSQNPQETASTKTAANAQNKRLSLMQSMGPNDVCSKEIARRTRVSQAVANADKGTVLKYLYTTQLARCTSQNAKAIWNMGFKDKASDLADCTKNGRSELEMERNERCAGDDMPSYNIMLAGTGMTVAAHMDQRVKTSGECNRYLNEMDQHDVQVDNALMAGTKALNPVQLGPNQQIIDRQINTGGQ